MNDKYQMLILVQYGKNRYDMTLWIKLQVLMKTIARNVHIYHTYKNSPPMLYNKQCRTLTYLKVSKIGRIYIVFSQTKTYMIIGPVVFYFIVTGDNSKKIT